jgi:hypothetical protein
LKIPRKTTKKQCISFVYTYSSLLIHSGVGFISLFKRSCETDMATALRSVSDSLVLYPTSNESDTNYGEQDDISNAVTKEKEFNGEVVFAGGDGFVTAFDRKGTQYRVIKGDKCGWCDSSSVAVHSFPAFFVINDTLQATIKARLKPSSQCEDGFIYLEPGDVVCAYELSNNWLRIRVPAVDGRPSDQFYWLLKQTQTGIELALPAIPSLFKKNPVLPVEAALRKRSLPCVNGSEVVDTYAGAYVLGMKVQIEDNDWVWVCDKYRSFMSLFTPDKSTQLLIECENVEKELHFLELSTELPDGSSLRLRAQPNKDGDVVTVINENDIIVVRSDYRQYLENDWACIYLEPFTDSWCLTRVGDMETLSDVSIETCSIKPRIIPPLPSSVSPVKSAAPVPPSSPKPSPQSPHQPQQQQQPRPQPQAVVQFPEEAPIKARGKYSFDDEALAAPAPTTAPAPAAVTQFPEELPIMAKGKYCFDEEALPVPVPAVAPVAAAILSPVASPSKPSTNDVDSDPSERPGVQDESIVEHEEDSQMPDSPSSKVIGTNALGASTTTATASSLAELVVDGSDEGGASSESPKAVNCSPRSTRSSRSDSSVSVAAASNGTTTQAFSPTTPSRSSTYVCRHDDTPITAKGVYMIDGEVLKPIENEDGYGKRTPRKARTPRKGDGTPSKNKTPGKMSMLASTTKLLSPVVDENVENMRAASPPAADDDLMVKSSNSWIQNDNDRNDVTLENSERTDAILFPSIADGSDDATIVDEVVEAFRQGAAATSMSGKTPSKAQTTESSPERESVMSDAIEQDIEDGGSNTNPFSNVSEVASSPASTVISSSDMIPYTPVIMLTDSEMIRSCADIDGGRSTMASEPECLGILSSYGNYWVDTHVLPEHGLEDVHSMELVRLVTVNITADSRFSGAKLSAGSKPGVIADERECMKYLDLLPTYDHEADGMR